MKQDDANPACQENQAGKLVSCKSNPASKKAVEDQPVLLLLHLFQVPPACVFVPAGTRRWFELGSQQHPFSTRVSRTGKNRLQGLRSGNGITALDLQMPARGYFRRATCRKTDFSAPV
jgi:hypothetical protein